jgi:hypothetical protein
MQILSFEAFFFGWDATDPVSTIPIRGMPNDKKSIVRRTRLDFVMPTLNQPVKERSRHAKRSTVAFICENNGTRDNSIAKPSAVKAIRRILLLQP